MTNKDRFVGWIVVLIFILSAFGWVSNFVKLIQLDFRAPYKAEVIRLIGLSPLGIILGYVHLKD